MGLSPPTGKGVLGWIFSQTLLADSSAKNFLITSSKISGFSLQYFGRELLLDNRKRLVYNPW
jgi:hypothetical protein